MIVAVFGPVEEFGVVSEIVGTEQAPASGEPQNVVRRRFGEPDEALEQLVA